MPRVDALHDVSRRDPEALVTKHVASELPADDHNADQLAERRAGALENAEPHEQASHAHHDGSATVPPARSARRATARRASTRRATARSLHDDNETRIIDFLVQHPGTTLVTSLKA